MFKLELNRLSLTSFRISDIVAETRRHIRDDCSIAFTADEGAKSVVTTNVYIYGFVSDRKYSYEQER